MARASGTLEGLHDFLGEPFDRARIETVLAVKHSYHTQAEGQLYSNWPRFVQVNKNLQGISLLVVDHYELRTDVVKIGGLMLPLGDAALPRFKAVLDERGRSIKFQAAFGLPSPGLAKRMPGDTAHKARFEVSFPRRPDEEHRLFFNTDELALTVRPDVLAPA